MTKWNFKKDVVCFCEFECESMLNFVCFYENECEKKWNLVCVCDFECETKLNFVCFVRMSVRQSGIVRFVPVNSLKSADS